MSLNTSHTPDGRGVLIYNGEMILLFSSNVKMSFDGNSQHAFKGKKSGSLYLTTHRIIFMNGSSKDELKSFGMPFSMLQAVKLEQPLLAPNYLKGGIQGLPGGNFDGLVEWKLSFPKGGCVEFGQALLRANAMAQNSRPFAAPPSYETSGCAFFAVPATYYIPPQGAYAGFQAPTHVFPEQPPVGNVYMYEAPPPYAGISSVNPYPAGELRQAGTNGYPSAPASAPIGFAPFPGNPPQYGAPQAPYPSQQPPAYSAGPSNPPQNGQQAPPLPEKTPIM